MSKDKLPLSDALERLAVNEEKFEGIVNGVEGHEEELGGKKTPSLRTIFAKLTDAAFMSECVQRACACAKHWALQANKIATEDAIIATGSTEARTLPDRFADIVNVKDFGAKGDGITDDTKAIQDAIEGNPGKNIYFPSGNYLVSKSLTTSSGNDSAQIIVLSSGTTLTAAAGFVGDFLLDLGATGNLEQGSKQYRNTGVLGGYLNCNGVCSGIRISRTHITLVRDTRMYGCTDFGIKVDKSNNTSSDAYIQNVYCIGTNKPGSVAYFLNALDNDVRDVRCAGFYVGIRTFKGGYISNAHPLFTGSAEDDEYNNSIGFDIGDAIVHLINCYADNFSTAIQVTGDRHWYAKDFTAYWYTNTYKNHTVFKMVNTRYFYGHIDGLYITIPSNGTNRGIWFTGDGINPYNFTGYSHRLITGLHITGGSWKNLTFHNTDCLFNNRLLDVYEYHLNNLDTSIELSKWYLVMLVCGHDKSMKFRLRSGTGLDVVVTMTPTLAGIKNCVANFEKNTIGAHFELVSKKIDDENGVPVIAVFLRLVKTDADYSPKFTVITISLESIGFDYYCLIPLRDARTYEPLYAGVTSVDGALGTPVVISSGYGEAKGIIPSVTYYKFAQSQTIPIQGTMQKLYVHAGEEDIVYVRHQNKLRRIYTSNPDTKTQGAIEGENIQLTSTVLMQVICETFF